MKYVPIIDMDATGKKICQLCEERGISGNELAEYLLQTPQAISKWKTGKSLPNLQNIIALMTIFNVEFEEVIVYKGGDEQSSPSLLSVA